MKSCPEVLEALAAGLNASDPRSDRPCGRRRPANRRRSRLPALPRPGRPALCDADGARRRGLEGGVLGRGAVGVRASAGRVVLCRGRRRAIAVALDQGDQFEASCPPCGAYSSVGRCTASAELTQQGDIFIRFDGGITPRSLPRDSPAPIGVRIEGTIRAPPGRSRRPCGRSRSLSIGAGRLDTRGLPTCPEAPATARSSTRGSAIPSRSAASSARIGGSCGHELALGGPRGGPFSPRSGCAVRGRSPAEASPLRTPTFAAATRLLARSHRRGDLWRHSFSRRAAARPLLRSSCSARRVQPR